MQIKKLILISLLICLFSQINFAQYKEFIYGDSVRTYAVFEPSLDPNPEGYPLVVGLHGGGSEGYEFLATPNLMPTARQEQFIVVCPNALRHPQYPLMTRWNAGDGYEAATDSTDDVGFISALIDSMIDKYQIDPERVYVMGFSNGSMMAYRVADELSHKIAAIGAVSGQMAYEDCHPEFPVPIIHFHGIEDDKNPYEGGPNSQNFDILPAVDTVMTSWREANFCTPSADTIYNENGIIGQKWASADGDGDIILYAIENWGHKWPTKDTLGISATELIWDFLKDHTRSNSRTIEGKTFRYAGKMRTYLVYDPSPNSGARPLVIGLHCHTGNASGLLTYTDLIQKATEENFVGVFPNSLSYATDTQWNAGGYLEILTGGTDDIGFISALLDTMIKNYDIDTTRIYVTGHSNGSMMSYRVAAEFSHRIAAMGGVAAPMVYEYCDPEFPVPIIHFHGLADSTCPFEGVGNIVPPVDSSLSIWRRINDCDSNPETIFDKNGVLGKKWTSSSGKSDVVLYTVENFGHGWPVQETEGISATDVIWDFMKLHTRSTVTKIEDNDKFSLPLIAKLYQNCPNPLNPSTKIKYHLTQPCNTTLKIYNLVGQEIETLVDEFQPAGEFEVTWHAKELPSGLYFCKIQAGDFSETKKLILLK